MALRMTEETKKALKGLLPFAPGAFVTSSLDCFDFLPEDQRPLFRQRDLTAEQFHAMRACAGEVPLSLMIQTLQEGALVGWENLPDSEFNEIPFSKEAIATLPPRWIEALYWGSARLCSPQKLERQGLGSSPVPVSDTWNKTAPSADAVQA